MGTVLAGALQPSFRLQACEMGPDQVCQPQVAPEIRIALARGWHWNPQMVPKSTALPRGPDRANSRKSCGRQGITRSAVLFPAVSFVAQGGGVKSVSPASRVTSLSDFLCGPAQSGSDRSLLGRSPLSGTCPPPTGQHFLSSPQLVGSPENSRVRSSFPKFSKLPSGNVCVCFSS